MPIPNHGLRRPVTMHDAGSNEAVTGLNARGAATILAAAPRVPDVTASGSAGYLR